MRAPVSACPMTSADRRIARWEDMILLREEAAGMIELVGSLLLTITTLMQRRQIGQHWTAAHAAELQTCLYVRGVLLNEYRDLLRQRKALFVDIQR
jgi:hypothetical protein